MNKKDLVAWLKDHDLMAPGHRNDDMVNLCILATMEHGAPVNDTELTDNIGDVVGRYHLTYDNNMVYDYFRSNMMRIFPYMKYWERLGIEYYTIN